MKKLIFILFVISIMFTMQSCDFLFEKKVETSWKCLVHYECYEEITFFTSFSIYVVTYELKNLSLFILLAIYSGMPPL